MSMRREVMCRNCGKIFKTNSSDRRECYICKPKTPPIGRLVLPKPEDPHVVVHHVEKDNKPVHTPNLSQGLSIIDALPPAVIPTKYKVRNEDLVTSFERFSNRRAAHH